MIVRSKQAISAAFYQNLFSSFKLLQVFKEGCLGVWDQANEGNIFGLTLYRKKTQIFSYYLLFTVLRVFYAMDITQRGRQ
jgi:hypothetical protein